MTDVHTLVVLANGNLVWSNCDSPAPSNHMPQGALTHAAGNAPVSFPAVPALQAMPIICMLHRLYSFSWCWCMAW